MPIIQKLQHILIYLKQIQKKEVTKQKLISVSVSIITLQQKWMMNSLYSINPKHHLILSPLSKIFQLHLPFVSFKPKLFKLAAYYNISIRSYLSSLLSTKPQIRSLSHFLLVTKPPLEINQRFLHATSFGLKKIMPTCSYKTAIKYQFVLLQVEETIFSTDLNFCSSELIQTELVCTCVARRNRY